MNACVDDCRTLQCNQKSNFDFFAVDPDPNNIPAIRLYSELGFKKINDLYWLYDAKSSDI